MFSFCSNVASFSMIRLFRFMKSDSKYEHNARIIPECSSSNNVKESE